jgi:hypothetical protein
MAKKQRRSAPLSQLGESNPSPTRKLQIVEPDGVPTYYVNSVSFELSNFDIKMRMCQIESGDASVLRVAEIARVFMSPPHVRAFAAALNGLVDKMDQAAKTHSPALDQKPN